MWFKFKNVVALIAEPFYLLIITILLGNPFNVKHLDNIVAMASTTKTTPAAIMASGAAVRQPSTPAIITTSVSTSASSTASLLTNSLFAIKAISGSDASKINNTKFAGKIVRNGTSEIDTGKYDRGFVKNYSTIKHIVLPVILTQLPATTAIAILDTKTTKVTATTMKPREIMTRTESTTRKLLSLSKSSQTTLAPTLTKNDTYENPTILHLNKTQLGVLASLSLLSSTSLNNSTENPISELKSLSTTSLTSASVFPSRTTSVSTSNLKFSNHETSLTALERLGSEQNMHNTNSHLSVDNANATIVSARRTSTTTISTTLKQLKHKKDTVTKLSALDTSSIAKGSLNGIGDSSSESKTNFNIKDLITVNRNISKNNTGTTRISARKVEGKYILSKAHKTDAPMLNYIFDTFSSANKHHHHDQRYGPHFEDVQLVGQPTNMTVQAGSSIHLNCRISLLQDKTVSWVRRNTQGENALDLLTVGLHTYTGDNRYKMEFQYPSNWRLKINNVKKDDEATYECQISTHPPRVIQIYLHVNAPKVMIVDEFGDPLQEKYYEQDSTLQLSCVVRNVAMSSSVVFWKHSEDVLNYDVTRGGVSVKTELMDDGANSTLFIAKINKADSGNYTCSISEYQNYTIAVHILNGESFAELHHGAAFSCQQLNHQIWLINLVLARLLLQLLPSFCLSR